MDERDAQDGTAVGDAPTGLAGRGLVAPGGTAAAADLRGAHARDAQAPGAHARDAQARAALAHRVEHVTAAAERLLVQAVEDRVRHGRDLAPEHGRLWSDLGSVLGGKLMRPRLTVTAYLGLGGTDVDAVAPVAAAQEMLHTAMLVHDDLLDHDEVRRGRPNVAGVTRARLAAAGVTGTAQHEQAGAAALLAGDAALAQAFALVAGAAVPAHLVGELVRLLAAGVDTTVAGELLDVRAEVQALADVDTLLVAQLKTAAYSFRVPLESGAVLAGASRAHRIALALVGTALGLAYQLTDDDLGVFGDPAATGKSVLSDLRSGKRTELLRLTWARTGASGRAVLRAHVGLSDLDDAGAARVRDVMRSCGALDEARALTRRTAGIARTLATTTLPEPLAGYLAGVVDDLVARGH
ncbi:polyprenyl synthetase family protein [Cellulomonas shaoxiangyii]|uniref:Polyprenyl synthetase family protein n=1 Tax=Cellulomonas shaoxiangyii TaxID=2566013 RepID=A0A4P7SGB9_9CELL|nr:polyprenyl synthetase family protein [Cellulomonas shaoxiangyii]QCB92658.1 polyprenyl synthetase family protein [Cellulomonas shaoxiangyii]TGY85466.1 polyprenyl synthetase family protein [Cellulomonas shaoxiangyii]